MHSASLTECNFSLMLGEIVAEVGSGSLCAHNNLAAPESARTIFRIIRHTNAIYSIAILNLEPSRGRVSVRRPGSEIM